MSDAWRHVKDATDPVDTLTLVALGVATLKARAELVKQARGR